jgi:hypothetical protein
MSAAQAVAGPGGQGEQLRLAGVVEVVDVAPVRRHRPLGGGALDEVGHRVVLADAGRPEGEDVEARVLDVDAEGERGGGARLADDAGQRLGFGGGLEAEGVGVAGAVKLVGGELADRQAWVPLGRRFGGARVAGGARGVPRGRVQRGVVVVRGVVGSGRVVVGPAGVGRPGARGTRRFGGDEGGAPLCTGRARPPAS